MLKKSVFEYTFEIVGFLTRDACTRGAALAAQIFYILYIDVYTF